MLCVCVVVSVVAFCVLRCLCCVLVVFVVVVLCVLCYVVLVCCCVSVVFDVCSIPNKPNNRVVTRAPFETKTRNQKQIQNTKHRNKHCCCSLLFLVCSFLLLCVALLLCVVLRFVCVCVFVAFVVLCVRLLLLFVVFAFVCVVVVCRLFCVYVVSVCCYPKQTKQTSGDQGRNLKQKPKNQKQIQRQLNTNKHLFVFNY